jgi:thioredoxin 1
MLIGELAERAGTSARTLRYYEEQGLVRAVTDATFGDTVLAARLPVVVDFWAQWCPPCRPVAKIIAELADEFSGQLTIAKIKSDENPGATRTYRVMSMPTLLFFRRGVVVNSIVGARPKNHFRQALTELITPYVNR